MGFKRESNAKTPFGRRRDDRNGNSLELARIPDDVAGDRTEEHPEDSRQLRRRQHGVERMNRFGMVTDPGRDPGQIEVPAVQHVLCFCGWRIESDRCCRAGRQDGRDRRALHQRSWFPALKKSKGGIRG